MDNTVNISLLTRLLLGATGVAIFAYFMFAASAGNGPLGTLLYLPLLAVYPVVSATQGWDPVKAGFETLREHYNKWSATKSSNAVAAN